MTARRRKASPVTSSASARAARAASPHVEALLGDELDLRLPPDVEAWLGLEPQGSDGFMPPHLAAVAMGVTEAELAAMIDRGWLTCRAVGSSVWVRPAAVSRMR